MTVVASTVVVPAARAVVALLLRDPAVLAAALPGSVVLTPGAEGTFEGTLRVPAGPLGSLPLPVTVVVDDTAAPGQFTLRLEATSTFGRVHGATAITLSESREGSTAMACRTSLTVAGRLAAMGGGVVEATAETMAREGLARFETALLARLARRPSPVDTPR